MDDYVQAVYGDIVLEFEKFLVEEDENEISFGQNFIYAFADTDCEGSMFHLILNLMFGMGHEEPCMLL